MKEWLIYSISSSIIPKFKFQAAAEGSLLVKQKQISLTFTKEKKECSRAHFHLQSSELHGIVPVSLKSQILFSACHCTGHCKHWSPAKTSWDSEIGPFPWGQKTSNVLELTHWQQTHVVSDLKCGAFKRNKALVYESRKELKQAFQLKPDFLMVFTGEGSSLKQ